MKKVINVLILFITFLSIIQGADAAGRSAGGFWAFDGGLLESKDEYQDAVSAGDAGLIPVDISYRYYADHITRVDFCHLAVNLVEVVTKQSSSYILNQKGFSAKTIVFTDTDDGIVSIAASLGIVNGVGNGLFLPDNEITRAEAAAMLRRTADLLGYHESKPALTFQDMSSQQEWAKKAVSFITASGIMKGTSNIKFSPRGQCTYTQAYETMWSLFKVLQASKLLLEEKTDGIISDEGNLVLNDGSVITMTADKGVMETKLYVNGTVADEYASVYTLSDMIISDNVSECIRNYTSWEVHGDLFYFSSISGMYSYNYITKRLTRYADWSVGDFKIYGDKIYILSNKKDEHLWLIGYYTMGCNELGYITLNGGNYVRTFDLRPLAGVSDGFKNIDWIEADGSVSISSMVSAGMSRLDITYYKILPTGFVRVIGYSSDTVYLYDDVIAAIARKQMDVNEALNQGIRNDYVVVKGVLTQYRGSEKDVIIPDNLGINKINSAFSDNDSIISVVIPAGVTQLYGAFTECSNLKSVKLGDGLIFIKDFSFAFCRNLEEINIPNGVTEIGSDAFLACKALRKIKIPATVTKIGDEAFRITALSSVVIPDSVTSIGAYAFCECSSLESITIPRSVINIGKDIFLDANPQIYCFKGSTAEEYAIANKLNYVLIEE